MKGDILSGVIITLIVVSSTILVINTINPFVQDSRDFQSFNEAKATLEKVNVAINDVFLEAPGSRRTLDLNIREGHLVVAGEEDKIKIILPGNLFPSGINAQQGNVVVSSGGASTLKAYESDIDNDGNTDLVLENSAVIFAVKKLGNSTSNVTINTSSIITLMRNSRLNLNVSYPHSGIFVNDLEKTSYGNGYTELTSIGNNLVSSSVHLHLNSTAANVTYDAVFSLAAGKDFLELQAKNVKGV